MGDIREGLVQRILDIEVRMFLRVPSIDEASCRAHLEEFNLHRRGQFATWSETTLESYLADLESAGARGENLMTVKYARMDNLIPRRSENPRIDEITSQFVAWQREFIEMCPNIMRRGRDIGDFTNYLRSELETYSDRTLELLWTDTCTNRDSGVNMSAEVYGYLARQSGYSSLEEMERSFS